MDIINCTIKKVNKSFILERKELNNINKLKKLHIRLIHKFIVKYLISCGGAFHHGKYGVEGKYVALMSDEKYHEYQKL